MDKDRLAAFEAVLPAISAFKRTFGRDIAPDFIAELYVARELDLELAARRNEPGADAVDATGQRYQVKCRSASTLNVDLNNFDFNFVVLVNLDDDYRLAGIWRMDLTKAQTVFVHRPVYRKWQATQTRFKAAAERVR